MADGYTDACHTMRRWKTTIKTVVSGFSLPVASFSYPARKKSLILRLPPFLRECLKELLRKILAMYRQRDRGVVRAPCLKFGGCEFKSCSDH